MFCLVAVNEIKLKHVCIVFDFSCRLSLLFCPNYIAASKEYLRRIQIVLSLTSAADCLLFCQFHINITYLLYSAVIVVRLSLWVRWSAADLVAVRTTQIYIRRSLRRRSVLTRSAMRSYKDLTRPACSTTAIHARSKTALL